MKLNGRITTIGENNYQFPVRQFFRWNELSILNNDQCGRDWCIQSPSDFIWLEEVVVSLHLPLKKIRLRERTKWLFVSFFHGMRCRLCTLREDWGSREAINIIIFTIHTPIILVRKICHPFSTFSQWSTVKEVFSSPISRLTYSYSLTDRRTDEQTDGRTEGPTDGPTGQTEGRTDRRTDRQTNRQTDGHTIGNRSW